MPKKTKETKTAPKVFDVAKPGETPESATSRPVIVGHSSMIKRDPMFAKTEEDEPAEPEEEKLAPKREKKITPPTIEKDSEEEKQEPQAEDSTPDTPAKEEKPKEADESKESNPSEEPEKQEESEDSKDDEIELDEAGKKNAKEEAAVARNAELQELIDSGEYALPIHQDAAKSNVGLWLFLILIIAVLGFVLAIDAELIDVGIELPFDFL